MDNIQIIHSPKGEELVVLTRKDYDRLIELVQDEDIYDTQLAKNQLNKLKASKTALVPLAIVKAELDGAHPVRAWREYRGLTAEELAKKANLSRVTLTHIENHTRKGTIENYKALASALKIGIDSVIE
jgi:DNA-binding XRE family transcriptional regulator